MTLSRLGGCTNVGAAVSTDLAFLIVSIRFCAIDGDLAWYLLLGQQILHMAKLTLFCRVFI